MSKNRNFYIQLFLLSLSIIFVLFFSWTTSPLYSELPLEYYDSAVYKVIGKFWAEGFVPYKDFWDQKGPFIHFLNLIGYLITKTGLGIFYIQVISLYVTLVANYRIIHLSCNEKVSLLFTTLIACSLSINYDGGNMVEEFLLPFISIAYYFLCRYFFTPTNTSNLLKFCFFAGLSFAVSLTTRLTNALGICACEGVILLYLLFRHEMRLMLKGFVYSIVGAFIILLPTFAYFLYYDALDDLWYGMFQYNMEYANTSSTTEIKSLSKFFILYFNCFLLIIISIYGFFVTRRKYYILGLISALVPLLWFYESFQFAHYGMIVFPLLAISIIYLHHIPENISAAKYIRRGLIAVILSVILYGVIFRIHQQYQTIASANKQNNIEIFYNKLFNDYSINKKSVLLYNGSGYIYMKGNIKPPIRFFFLHDFLIHNGKSIEKKILTDLEKVKVEWIIATGDIQSSIIKEYVDINYKKVCTRNSCVLYKFKKSNHSNSINN